MKKLSRRSFMKNTAVATGGLALGTALQGNWISCSQARANGYFESEFGINEGLCQRILSMALSRGGDFADLYFEHTISNRLLLQDGKVNRAFCNVALGIGIRTVKGDQVGYGFTQELIEDSMLAAAATAATISDASPKEAAGHFTQLKMNNYYPLDTLLTKIPLA